MISERELDGVPFYYLARRFPDGGAASEAFERLNVEGQRMKGKLDLGVYRIVPFGIGEPTVLAIVSLGRSGLELAELAIGGADYDGIADDQVEALMMRRVRVVAQLKQEGIEAGRLVLRRGKRGAHLRSDGTMEEQG